MGVVSTSLSISVYGLLALVSDSTWTPILQRPSLSHMHSPSQVPGIIHAFYIVHKYNENFEDIERGGLEYQPVPSEEPNRVGYGSTNAAGMSSIPRCLAYCLFFSFHQQYALSLSPFRITLLMDPHTHHMLKLLRFYLPDSLTTYIFRCVQ